MWHESRQQSRTGWTTNRAGAMCILKDHASFDRQPVNIGCPGFDMSTECAHPVVEIIDGDEQDIGMLCRNAGRGDARCQKHDCKC